MNHNVYHKSMRHRIFFPFTLMLCCVAFLHSTPSWVVSYGSDTPYRLPAYISGYGASDGSSSAERLEAARNVALSQLSKQIRMRVVSEESYSTIDDGSASSERYLTDVRTSSDVTVSGARFEVHETAKTTHVLAYVETGALYSHLVEKMTAARQRLDLAVAGFDMAFAAGNPELAQQRLLEADTALTQLSETISLMNAVRAATGTALTGFGTPTVNSVEQERKVRERRETLQTFTPANMEQAATDTARQLAGSLSGPVQVMPLVYQDADFSSSFGNRMSLYIASAIEQRRSGRLLSAQDQKAVVVRGSYWVDAQQIEVYATARDASTGTIVGTARTTVPISAVDRSTLEPANISVALKDRVVLLTEQIVDGGIGIEVWTDKGRDEGAVVYTEGTEVQIYLRVNQPAFLQITYVLATGEVVLLEESYYIGIEKVNRVVALPYRFDVVPPFGVERLVVTAHSNTPPRPNVTLRQIDGQWYEILGSVLDAISPTRGLARKRDTTQDTTIKVGEASIVLTTMAYTK